MPLITDQCHFLTEHLRDLHQTFRYLERLGPVLAKAPWSPGCQKGFPEALVPANVSAKVPAQVYHVNIDEPKDGTAEQLGFGNCKTAF